MLRPGFVFLVLTASTFVAAAYGCHKEETCGDCSAGGFGGTGGVDAGSDAPTTFPCKGMTCQIGTEACTVTEHFNQNAMGECTPLPAACAMDGATCDCFGTMDPACMCEQQPTGDFAIFCNYDM